MDAIFKPVGQAEQVKDAGPTDALVVYPLRRRCCRVNARAQRAAWEIDLQELAAGGRETSSLPPARRMLFTEVGDQKTHAGVAFCDGGLFLRHVVLSPRVT